MTYSTIYTPGESWIGRKPYMLAIVKLDEGPHDDVPGHLRALRRCKIGMRVRHVFRKIGQDGEKGMIHYGTKFVPDK